MRLATIATETGLRLHVKGSTGYVDAAQALGKEQFSSLHWVLERGENAMAELAPLQEREGIEVAPADLGPAVPSPPRILCLGVNYSEHALEGGREVPSWPESFVRGTGSVIGPFQDLIKPALSDRFDYEGELGIVIGRGGRYIRARDAFDAIAGYVVLNDASAREWQRASTQWTAGKNFEGSMPIGPELVTADSVDVSAALLTTKLNGDTMQSASTDQMIVDIASAIEFFSSFTHLRPGDVIATGTPGGVGFARTPPVWLEPGDVVEVSIEGIGTIRNKVVAEVDAPRDWRWRPDPGGASRKL